MEARAAEAEAKPLILGVPNAVNPECRRPGAVNFAVGLDAGGMNGGRVNVSGVCQGGAARPKPRQGGQAA